MVASNIPLSAEQLKEQIIKEAISSVNKHEERDYRRKGCLAGLELCRQLTTPDDFRHTIEDRIQKEYQLRTASAEEYWEHRCATAQVEFVWERMKIAWDISGSTSALAYCHVAELMGWKI